MSDFSGVDLLTAAFLGLITTRWLPHGTAMCLYTLINNRMTHLEVPSPMAVLHNMEGHHPVAALQLN